MSVRPSFSRSVRPSVHQSGQTSLFLIVFWLLWSVQLFSFRHSFSKVLSDLREREFWIGRSRYERIESRPSLLLLHYYFLPRFYICRFWVRILIDSDYAIFIIILAIFSPLQLGLILLYTVEF